MEEEPPLLPKGDKEGRPDPFWRKKETDRQNRSETNKTFRVNSQLLGLVISASGLSFRVVV